ncbi:hypothetical protein B2J93_2684 [Marssonina coronariae]|uniref:DUF7905 domain-containing protein n=1 Tax=Diplocarpon coronariae TaxID=2795749 RepID=A0A218Z6Z8_9HELO|nr:hypothetical protein B2J93_2684 [Marssonina coronariae]
MKKLKERSVDPEIDNAKRWENDTNVGGSTVGGSTIVGSGDGFAAPGDQGPLISFLSAQTSTGPAPRVPHGFAIQTRDQARDQARYQDTGIGRSTPGGLGTSTSGNTLRSRASGTTGGLGGAHGNAYSAGNTRSTSGSFDPNAYGKPNVGLPRSTPGRFRAHGNSIASSAGIPRSTSGSFNAHAARTSHTSPGKGIPRSTSDTRNVVRQGRSRAESGDDSSGSVDIITDRRVGRNQSFTGRSPAKSRIFADRSGTTSMNSARKWAKSTDLVTSRKAVYREATAFTEQDREQFKRAPAEDEHFPYMGFYIWPLNNSTPESLFGWRLELLDPLRVGYRVFIEAHTASNCLSVSSRDNEGDIQPVLDGIRLAVKHAVAKTVMARPVYFVVPPSPLAMKTIVRPREFRPAPHKFAKFLELAGSSFSKEEQENWKGKRAEMVADGRARFEKILVGNMMKIEPLKGWMRMRVYLGFVELTAYFKGFAASKVSFDKFVEMVTNPRQTGGFDKKMQDARTAMRFRDKILSSSNIFGPVQGRTNSLHEVEFKNTETLIVETVGGKRVELEAEIDRSWEDDVSFYQTGSIRLFRGRDPGKDQGKDPSEDMEQKNKLIEMTTIDIERGIDCKLEVIADDEITTIPSEFHQLVRTSITAKSRVCVDKLGLEYPQVNPHATSELRIAGVVVKSVVQYKIVDSGHIVEIAIYREWSGTATKEVPSMRASVSLFHPDWDEWMESIENTTRSRKFGNHLCNLFHDGTPGQGSIDTFFEKMMMVQGLLADAKKERDFQIRQAALAAGEESGERI